MGAKNSVLPPLNKENLELDAQQRFGLDHDSYMEVQKAFDQLVAGNPKNIIDKMHWDTFFDKKCEDDKDEREMYDDVWRLFGCDKSGKMEFGQFLLFMCVGVADQKTKLTASFALADRKCAGKLTAKELFQVFERPILEERRRENPGVKKMELAVPKAEAVRKKAVDRMAQAEKIAESAFENVNKCMQKTYDEEMPEILNEMQKLSEEVFDKIGEFLAVFTAAHERFEAPYKEAYAVLSEKAKEKLSKEADMNEFIEKAKSEKEKYELLEFKKLPNPAEEEEEEPAAAAAASAEEPKKEEEKKEEEK